MFISYPVFFPTRHIHAPHFSIKNVVLLHVEFENIALVKTRSNCCTFHTQAVFLSVQQVYPRFAVVLWWVIILILA